VQTVVNTQIFSNASLITITDHASATPYPSTLAVAGVAGPVTNLTVTINGLAHAYPSDVGILLVGPGGQDVVLVQNAGSGHDITNVVLTLDDKAVNNLTTGAITNGTYRPTDLGRYEFDAPAPAYPYGAGLMPLAASPNGTWSLYVQDFASPDAGVITGGWSLKFLTTATITNCCSTFPRPTLTSTTYSNNVVHFRWSSLPGPHYQVQYRTNLTTGSWQNVGTPLLGTNTITDIIDNNTNSRARFYRVMVTQ
jgi:subtilisin-like proprotein convertase family protein